MRLIHRCRLAFSVFLISAFQLSAQSVGTALVRHAPSVNGTVDGSIQQMMGESVTFNGGAVVTGDLLVPGTPTVRLNGNPRYSGTVDGSGTTSPSNFQVTLNGNAELRHVVRRTNAVTLPAVSAPPPPAGTRSVTISSSAESPGNFSTLRNLTLNGNVGQFAIPSGTYGDFTANGGSGFTLGVVGATQPSVYNFQHLTLNGQAQIQLLGPVVINLANSASGNGNIGSPAYPAWLTLNVYSGGFTLNGGCNFYGYVSAPNGTITVNGNSQLIGGTACDRLVVNGSGLLRLVAPASGNTAPIAYDQTVPLNEDSTAAIVLTASDAEGNSLVYSIVTPPAHGTVTGTPPNITYIPVANYKGGDTFTFKANDGQLDSNIATVRLEIAPVNDAPVADAKSIVLDEDTSANVILSGSDIDGDALSFTFVQPAHGTLTGSPPNLIYTPAPDYNGNDSFTYRAFDGALYSPPATVAITVRPVNDAPIATPGSYAVNENATLAIVLSATDVDHDPLTFTVLTQPTHGTLTGTAPNLTYQPFANFNAIDSFTFVAFDGTATSAPATITIQVTNLNDPPIANSQSVQTAEDTSKAITLTGSDPDGDAITFVIVTPPAHGTLSGTAPNLTYTPAPNYNGPDGFTFKTRDPANTDSNLATVSITVTPVNDAPVAAAQALRTLEDTSLAITLTGTDVDGDTLTFAVVTQPQHGTLTGTAPNLTYTPARDYNGSDSFTFKANDGGLDSAPATIAITVVAVNDPPVATAQALTTAEDTPLAIVLSATDVDSSAFTFTITAPPAHGTLSGTLPNVTYTPAPDYYGPDSFTFTANDGDADSAPATISLTVTPVNDAPVATSQTLTQPQDTPVNFTLAATDVEGDALTYTIITPPAHGTLTGTAPNYTYTPTFNYRGSDSLVFKANDGQLDSNVATVTFVMTPVSHAPVASAQSVSMLEDVAQNIVLGATDQDGDSLTYVIVIPPTHGTLSGSAPSLIYTPAANYNGADSFTFKANDGALDSNEATITLTITPVNDAPVASAQSLTLAEDTSLGVVLGATDVDGDALTFTVLTQPQHGTLSGSAPNLTYTPAANYFGTDSFTFKARDGVVDSNIATISLTVTPVNDAPVANAQSLTTPEDTPLGITLTATDVDSPTLTFTLVTPPAHGTLSGTAPNFSYAPAHNYNGPDSFTFKANDGVVDSAPATITLAVTPVNDAPVANPLTIAVTSGTPTPIVLTGSDVDSPALTFSVTTPPQHGTLTGTPPNLTYTSNANFGGYDSFNFVANDGQLNSAPATVQIIAGLSPRSRTYTTTADFAGGTLSSISTDVADQISNKTVLTSFDVVWIANSTKGTVVKLDPETGRVLGEYYSAPTMVAAPYPSRIAVDSKGNAWVANLSHNSIVKIGIPQNGGWVDRNANGLVETSSALGDLKPWSGADSISSASDEAILLYVRTTVSGVRQVAIDADDNVWVTGNGGPWEKFDGKTGALLRTERSLGQGENGGFLAASGKMYSTGHSFLVWDVGSPIASLPIDDNVKNDIWGAAVDSQGNLWCTRDGYSTVLKYSPTGQLLGEFFHGEGWGMGIAIDANDHVWIAHSHCGHTVGHLLPNGTFVGNVEVSNHGPVEVSIDRRGRIWVVSSTGVVERINPLGGALGTDGITPIGLMDVQSGNLGGTLWTYGRFTGSTFALATPDGSWTSVYDGQLAGTTWGPISLNGLLCNDARIEISAALSADGINFGAPQTLSIANLTPSGAGRYLKTTVRLVSASSGESPVLYDFTVGTSGYSPPPSPRSWFVSAGDEIKGNWPDLIQLKGAFCHSVHTFPAEADSYLWSVVSGPGTVTFNDATKRRTTAQFSAQGTYILRLTGTLGTQVSTSDVKVTLTPYNRAPYANAGYTTFRSDVPPQLWLWGSVRDDGLPVGNAVTSTWSKLFGPGTVTFANPNAPSTTASFSAPGVYILRLSATDGELTGQDVTTVWLGFSCIPAAPSGLVSWWQASGNGDDHIGGNQAFTEKGADYVEGKIGGAFRFGGVNDRVRVFAAPSLNVGTGDGFSLEMWVNPSSVRTATIFEYGQGNTHGFSLRQVGNQVEANFRDSNGVSHLVTTNNVLTAGVWTHVAATYNRAMGEGRIFINGAPAAAQVVGSFTLSTAYDVFFAGAANATEPFGGLLDEISLYNRTIYADEILTIYSHPAGKRPPVSNVAPTVDAGPNLFTAANTPVTLGGSVTDDGQPTNGTLTTLWSKVSGPGTVVFADATRPNTSATFSDPGVYVLKLFADDGGFCTEDLVEVRVNALYKFDTDSSLAAWWTGNDTDLDEVRKLKLERFNGLGYAPGYASEGFLFDGVNDYARVATDGATNLGAAAAGLTVEFWVKPAQAGSHDAWLFYWGTPTTDGVRVLQGGNNSSGRAFTVYLRDTTGFDHAMLITGTFTANTWAHLAVTYNKATGFGRIYLNGVLALEQSLGVFTPRTNLPMMFGSDPNGTGRFEGVLDEVSLYTRPLALEEIQGIYSAGVQGKVPLDNNQAPNISAGADIFALSGSLAVTLNGTVTDDGLPSGNVTSVSWTKVEGPGTATFANPNAASTTVTFSAPGTYVLRLDGNDGRNQPPGSTVVVRVGVTDSVEPDSSLAAWWPANGNIHEVVHGNHDIEFLPRGPAFATGQIGQGFSFNGTDHYGRTPAHSDLNIGASTAGLTIEFWAKPAQAGSHDGWMMYWGSSSVDGLRLLQGGNNSSGRGFNVILRDTTGFDHSLYAASTFVANTWVHLAVTYDRVSGIGRIYRNGVLALETNLGIFTTRTDLPLAFGADANGTGGRYEGVFDEISLYTRPLALADIQAIYNAGVSGKAPLDDNQPPVVNAGPDVVSLNASAPVQLNGSVIDDGKPVGYPLTIAWSKVEGPGTVTFADPSSPTTTATFSVAGTYVLRLDARDVMHAATPDTMVVRVGVTGSVEPDSALAAWWPANGDIREVVHGNHDIEFLPRGPAFATGQIGQGFSFNGTDHYGRTPAHSDLNIGASTAGLTIEFWAKPAQAGSHDGWLMYWGSSSVDGLRLLQGGNNSSGRGFNVILRDTTGFDHSLYAASTFVANTWVHLAVTYDRVSGMGRIYRNGVLALETNLGIFTTRTDLPLAFGADANGTGGRYEGGFDEISLYTRPLALADIQAIYNAGVSGKAPLDDNQPPVVNAGPDVVSLSVSAPVPLNGSVVDDGRPVGSPLIIAWSKVEGPGTVTFADPSSPTTTATFSAAGTYVLRLDARDGLEAAVPDTMVVRVGVTASVEPDSSLAAWWPANGDVREMVHGSHDIEFLPRGPAFATGQIGQGFSFNGTDHYGRTAAHSDLNIGTSASGLTVEFWAKPAQAGSHDGWMMYWGNSSVDGLRLLQGGNNSSGRGFNVTFRDTAGIDHGLYVASTFTANTWTHLAVTYDRTSGMGRIYRNGALALETNLGIFATRTDLPLAFGSDQNGTGARYEGVLDEVSLYTRALSLADIQAIYAAGVSGKAPLDDNQPPVVSAGPDVTAPSISTPVQLSGSVIDDGRPAGYPLTIAWSKVDGPGTVAFTDASSPTTTATFSVAGTYVLRLDARDAMQAAVPDTMVVRVGVTGGVAPDSALAAWWPGNGEIHEVVHGNHDIELLPNGPAFATGQVGQGFNFGGADYGRTAAHSDLNIGTSASGFTVEFWAKPSQAGSHDAWLLYWGSSTTDGLRLLQGANNSAGRGFYLLVRDTAGVDHGIYVGSVFTANTWVHIAATYDRATGMGRVYRNGVLSQETSLGVFTTRTDLPLAFGSDPNGNSRYEGVLDEISLYTRPLALADIQAIFNAGASGRNPIANNIPPSVALVTPPSASTVQINTAISFGALAADTDGSVAKVEFFDGTTKLGETTTAQSGQPLAFNFTLSAGFTALGRHVITARATDNSGAVASSGAVLLDVVPILPVIALTSPANDSVVAAGAPVTLQASATYSGGALARVEFYDGAVKLGQSTTPTSGSTYAFAASTGFTPGNHSLSAKAVAVDGATAISTSIVVTATASPPAVAITAPVNNATIAASTAFTIAASATDADGTITKVEFFRGSTKLGEDLTAPYTFDVTAGLPVGTYVLTAKATDNTGLATTSASVTINVISYTGAPVATLSTPAAEARLTAPTAVTGVVAHPALASWGVDYRLKAAEGAPDEPWTTFATGTGFVGTPANGNTAAVPGALGTFDPTLLINGIYELRLRVTDTTATTLIDGPVSVVVEGNMKVGAFSLAFEDLKVPVAGIPITITRTYDSRDTRVGDFGPGWRLALANIRVQKNRNLGAGWYQTPQQGSGIQFYNVDPIGDRIVTVVMPDGETNRFKIGAYVKNRPGDPDDASFAVVVREGQIRFYPIGDTTSKLEPLDASSQLADHFYIGGTGNQDLTSDQLGEFGYNATRFRLTSKDGSVFILDEKLGLLEMRDLDGNTLALNRDAQNRVTSVTATQNAPSGAITRSITIHRDATGRVDYIRDLASKELDYLYDAQGRLSSFTNRELNVTQFRYENASFPYYLTKIIDPRGITALRSEYDTSGKLVKQIDADGKETVFTHGVDQPSRFEKVKDRLGNETTFYYDDGGNVVTKIDPLGAQTTFSYYADSDRVKFETDHYGNVKSFAYDAAGNVLVQTIGASASQDPANPTTGYTTRMSYNAQSAPTQITDPDGRVQMFSYDATTNNLLSRTMGAGGAAPATTGYTYYADGTLDTITDALGNLTKHIYNYSFTDANYPGAVKQTTVTVKDPAGAAGSDAANATDTILRTTRTLFDAQENQLAQIVTRTLPDGSSEDVVTRYIYDTENRLKATLMPDGRVNEMRYTSFGKTDRVALWKSLADYTQHDDANARITSYSYDARGNQTSMTYADGTSEAMSFDAENRKAWSQDRRGYRTFFTYDADGRLRFTIQPDGNDGVGASAPTVATDARLADNPRTETVYDLAGRVTDTYDELRHRTQNVYFPDGTPDANRRKQMVAVRSVGNLVTSYQYDGAGNVRYVTDPRGNTVETRYDDQGRPRFVIYPATDENPATQTETKYDLLGRRVEVVDQEGKVMRYRYDGLGRLSEVRQYIDATLAASDANFSLAPTTANLAVTRYTYDAAGNQQTQIDALGRVTTYWTDMLGRRTKRILPKDAAEATFLTENLQYDEWGNLWKRTDFAGKTTTFGYDTLNRLKSKTADSTHPSLAYSQAIARVEFDYDNNGARTAARTFNASNAQLYAESTPRDERGRIDYKDTAGGRLDYSYYANSLLKDVVSSNSGGVNIGYRYDEVNRLESVDDTSTGLPTRTTGYTYNPNGSLETLAQPNGVVHTYNYDTLNRLRGLLVTRATTLLHTYEYKLNPSGHRRQVVENSTRTTNYDYDGVYRLTGESIAGDANGNNGTIGYDLDKVGNRRARNSQLAALSSQLNQSYNARDWLAGDSYNANGSTTTGALAPAQLSAGAFTDTYDFEERLILRTKSDGSTINVSYDADGHRIAKNLLNASAQSVSSTAWLVDTNNLTGYCQVMEERVATSGGTTTRLFTYGTALISQAVSLNAQAATLNYYATDGHGNVRELTDATGAVTDRYDYDAFGVLVFRSGTTLNAFLYCGEQYDADLGLYYLRARYVNPDSGRFWGADSFEGFQTDPISLHRYLYAGTNPVMGFDPSGHWTLNEAILTVWDVGVQAGLAVARAFPAAAATAKTIAAVTSYTLSALNLYWFATDSDFRGLVASMPDGAGVLVADVAKLAELGQGLISASRSLAQAANVFRFSKATNIKIPPSGAHQAEVTLLDKEGKLVTQWGETSGGQTPEQLAMGFPAGSLASHTEVKACQKVHLSSGETMIIRGTLPPCPNCQGTMRASTRSGGRIEYHYAVPSRENGEDLIIEVWESGAKQ